MTFVVFHFSPKRTRKIWSMINWEVHVAVVREKNKAGNEFNIEARSRRHCCRGKAIILSYPACKEHASCFISSVTLSGCLYTFSHKQQYFREKVTGHKIWVLTLYATLIWNISYSKKNSAKDYHKCTKVFMYPFLSDCFKTPLNKIAQILQKCGSHFKVLGARRVTCSKFRTEDAYTGCPRRNGQNFGRVFLMLNYTDITQNTCVQCWTVTEIKAREKCGLFAVPRTVPGSRYVIPIPIVRPCLQPAQARSSLRLHM